MTKPCAISFIIPCFNEEALIASCIQTIEIAVAHCGRDGEYEIIVVDNNSTDGTRILAESLGASVVPCLKQGLTPARQTGMHAARYAIHAYIDADCRVPPHWLDANLSKLIDDPGCAAISGPIWFDKQGPFARVAAAAFSWFQFFAHHSIGATLQGGNYIVKRDALVLSGGHAVDIDFYGEDTDLARRLSKIGKVKFLRSMWSNTSARRFVGGGYMRTAFIYSLNYFSVHLLHRPVTKTHVDYRELR